MRDLLPQEALAEQLARTVPTLREMTHGLDLDTWRHRPGPDQWSITEVVCHLRDVDREVHYVRLRSLTDLEEPFMPGVVSDAWAVERDYQSQDGPQAFADLVLSRRKLLSLLPPVGASLWERRGRHTFFGPTTFWELVCLVLEHDELHIEQVRQILATA
jgi:hypothetical protein